MLPLTFLRARIVMFVYFVKILNLFLQLYFYFIIVTNEKKGKLLIVTLISFVFLGRTKRLNFGLIKLFK